MKCPLCNSEITISVPDTNSTKYRPQCNCVVDWKQYSNLSSCQEGIQLLVGKIDHLIYEALDRLNRKQIQEQIQEGLDALDNGECVDGELVFSSFSEYYQLISERDTVNNLLKDIPDDQVLDRVSLQARLDHIEAQLSLLRHKISFD